VIATERFERVEVSSLDQLRDWLAANHGQEDSVWLVRYKAEVPDKHVTRLQLLDELLCWGWVDGLARKLDDRRTMQLISPRKQQAWAQTYKDRVAHLTAENRMQPPGLAAIEISKQAGLWEAYAPVDALSVPEDLRAALADNSSAQSFFEAAAPSYRRNVLRWIWTAKKPETRAKRIAIVLEHSTRGGKVPQM
jgi:uncharacterized protein YdeI (YjbR/CyaY-like superfamily)